MIEKTIAYVCGPALAGIKPANLVACYKEKIPAVHKEIAKLNWQLNKKGIYFEVLCECEKRVLLMVYREAVLYRYLRRHDIQQLLHGFGYEEDLPLQGCIQHLKERMDTNRFPHEIGAFLGYPVHDIYGFIYHRDKGCLLTGEWKVYKNPEAAKKLFSRYQACRCAIIRRMEQGKTLAEIFCAA